MKFYLMITTTTTTTTTTKIIFKNADTEEISTTITTKT